MAQEPDDFDPVDYIGPYPDEIPIHGDDSIVAVKGDVFKVTPPRCDACALWIHSDFTRLHVNWCHFWRRLERHRVERLVGDKWEDMGQSGIEPIFMSCSGCLLRITPSLEKLRYLYLFPNRTDSFVRQPTDARLMVMAALERLDAVGATVVSMNGIHGGGEEGHSRLVDEEIKHVMLSAIDDWRMANENSCIKQIFLVDVGGAFGQPLHRADPDTVTSESPNTTMEDQVREMVRRVLGNSREHSFLFYARSGFDWTPLRRLSHLCDVFVFCDSQKKFEEFDDVIPGIRRQPVDEFRDHVLNVKIVDRVIAPFEMRAGKMERRCAGKLRVLLLLYLTCDEAEAYTWLFVANRIAPKILCLGDRAERIEYGGPLGQVMQEHQANMRKVPLLLLSNRTEHGWERWPTVWQKYPGWQEFVAYSRQVAPRTVRVYHEPLTPDNLPDGAQAVVVPHAMVQANNWPEHVIVICMAGPDESVDHPNWRNWNQFECIKTAGLPMNETLDELDRICARRAIDHVASIRFGFEDESPVLTDWRKQDSRPHRLDFYDLTEGDFLSLDVDRLDESLE